MSQTKDDEFRQHNRIAADLELSLCEHVWNEYRPLRLAGADFEVVCIDDDDAPEGFDDDAVLLRRKSDGQIFVADIEVTINPVKAESPAGERAAVR